jgi:hypothetical protein
MDAGDITCGIMRCDYSQVEPKIGHLPRADSRLYDSVKIGGSSGDRRIIASRS